MCLSPCCYEMSVSEDIQLCPTLRSAPRYRKLPLSVLYAIPRGRLWPMTGPGWESQPRTPIVGQLGSLSQLPSAQENQLESHCRSAFSARLSFALSYISWEHCPRPIFPFSTYLIITESFLENPI